jgi:hypothetical protein
MALSEQARSRLADIADREPTKNKELQEAWGMESGSEVHQYLEAELRDYYYRDENSLICVTEEGKALIGGAGGESGVAVELSGIEREVFAVVPGPGERSESVVSILHRVEDEFDAEPTVEAVRKALQTLARKGVLEKVMRSVPTYRLALPRSEVELLSADPA